MLVRCCNLVSSRECNFSCVSRGVYECLLGTVVAGCYVVGELVEC